MAVVPHREVACAILIDRDGRILLQRRDNDPNILYPGKIGLFGGHREVDETFLGCVVREVYEETGYLAPPERFQHLGSYVGPDSEVPGASVAGEYYVLRDVPADALVVTEGSLLIVERNDLIVRAPQFAPSATAAFGMLISKGLT